MRKMDNKSFWKNSVTDFIVRKLAHFQNTLVCAFWQAMQYINRVSVLFRFIPALSPLSMQ